MIHVDLPYDYGTFVKVKTKQSGTVDYGTVAAYMVMDDGWCIWVSGYRQSWCGEFLPEDIETMSELEIKELKVRYHEE